MIEVKDQRTKTQVIYDKLLEVEETLISMVNEVDESDKQEFKDTIEHVTSLRKKVFKTIKGGK